MGHLGALIIPPTGTGNFNNYLFSHVTDDPGLFAALRGRRAAGDRHQPASALRRPRHWQRHHALGRCPEAHELAFGLSGPTRSPTPASPRHEPHQLLDRRWRAGNAVLEYNISGLRAARPQRRPNAVGDDLQAMVGTALSDSPSSRPASPSSRPP